MADLTELSLIPEVDDADRVVDLIARLPRENVVRRLVLQVVQGRPIESIQPLLNSLKRPGIRRWRERQAAAWALGRTRLAGQDAEDAVSLLEFVVEGAYRESVWTRLLRGAGVTLLSALGCLIIVELLGGMGNPSDEDFVMAVTALSCALFPLTLPLTLWHARMRDTHIRAAAARSLGHIASVESVGTLAAALNYGSAEIAATAAQSLHALLPLITSEHYGSLGTQTVENLGRALSYPDGQLAFKLLAALGKAGTSAAIPYVEQAYRRGQTMRGKDAAKAVLDILLERKARETERDRLLRPSTGVHDPSVLLRTPTAASEDTSLLLQPASDGG